MATAVINGTDVTSFCEGLSTLANGTYYCHPPIGPQPFFSATTYEEIPVTFPAIDGQGRIRLGFRRGLATFLLVSMHDTVADAQTLVDTLLTSWRTNSRFSITMPGGSEKQGFKLVQGSGGLSQAVQIGGKVCFIWSAIFEQLSETN